MTPLDLAVLCAFVAGVASTLTLVVVALYLRTCLAEFRAHGPHFELRRGEAEALRRTLDGGGPVLRVVQPEKEKR